MKGAVAALHIFLIKALRATDSVMVRRVAHHRAKDLFILGLDIRKFTLFIMSVLVNTIRRFHTVFSSHLKNTNTRININLL